MNKVTKILLIIVCVLLAIYFFVSGYEKKTSSLTDLIGNRIGGGELGVSDYYSLAQCIETYRDLIINNDFENAYKMLNNNYKNYVPFEKYKEEVLKKDYSKLRITDIKAITPTTFKIVTHISGDNENFTVVIGNTEPKSFLLFPNSFLDYRSVDKSVKKNNVEFVLKDYIVNIDGCTFNFEINNNSGNELRINSATLYTNLKDKIVEHFDAIVQANKSKSINISCKSDYAFPEKIVLNCSNALDIEFTL